MPDSKKQRRKLEEKPKSTTTKKPRPDKLALEIGRRIVEARNGLGFSQLAVHTRTKWADPEGVGISRAALSLYETGTNKPGAREILLICETLSISPNWLICGSESPARLLAPSSDFLQGNDLQISTRLAYAMLALDPTDRDALAHLVFSMLTKKLGDTGLSSLMMMGNFMYREILKKVSEVTGADSKNPPTAADLESFVNKMTESFYTNYGNTRPAISDDAADNFDPDHHPPPRQLK